MINSRGMPVSLSTVLTVALAIGLFTMIGRIVRESTIQTTIDQYIPYKIPTWTGLAPQVAQTSPQTAWFSGKGLLRLDIQNGFNTYYETPMEMVDKEKYVCDEERFPPDDLDLKHPMCICQTKLTAAFFGNLAAQKSFLEGGEPNLELVNQRLQETYDQLESIRGKRALIIGDSMDRYWLEDIVSQYSALATLRALHYTGEELEQFWSNGYLARSVTYPILPSVDAILEYANAKHGYTAKYDAQRTLHPDTIRLDLCFVHGTYETSEIDGLLGGVTPTSSDARLQLSKEMWGGHPDQEGTPYSMISLNLGMWDLLRNNFNNFLETGRDYCPGLTIKWITNYIDRSSRFIGLIRDYWGTDAHLVFRTTTDINFNNPDSYMPNGLPADTPRDLAYTPLRFQQIRDAQDDLLQRNNISSIPFSHIMRGQSVLALRDIMHPGPEANKLYMELFFRRLEEAPSY